MVMSSWCQVSEGRDPVSVGVLGGSDGAGMEQTLSLNELVCFLGAGTAVEGAGLSFATMCQMIKCSSLWVVGV